MEAVSVNVTERLYGCSRKHGRDSLAVRPLREQPYAPPINVYRSLMCPCPQTADYVGNVSGARTANES
jgi:hypothetical protein